MRRPRTAAVDALVDTITAERQVVEYLLFKLTALKMLLIADERRFIERAANEVERVIATLREAEERREVALAAVAADWDVPVAELTMSRLSREAPDPTAKVLRDLHRELQKLADDVESVVEDNRRLVASGLGDVQLLLDTVAGSS